MSRVMCCLAVMLILHPVLAAEAAGEEMYVQVRASKLRAQPQHWAEGVRTVEYGDRLSVVGRRDGWLRARDATGAEGYIHATAVTERRVVLDGGGAVPLRGGSRDVVLAGKGFDREVERAFASQNRSLNYSAVDTMESLEIGDRQLAAFIEQGRLAQ